MGAMTKIPSPPQVINNAGVNCRYFSNQHGKTHRSVTNFRQFPVPTTEEARVGLPNKDKEC